MYWTIFKWKPCCVWNTHNKLSGYRILKWIISVNDILYMFFILIIIEKFYISLFFNLYIFFNLWFWGLGWGSGHLGGQKI